MLSWLLIITFQLYLIHSPFALLEQKHIYLLSVVFKLLKALNSSHLTLPFHSWDRSPFPVNPGSSSSSSGPVTSVWLHSIFHVQGSSSKLGTPRNQVSSFPSPTHSQKPFMFLCGLAHHLPLLSLLVEAPYWKMQKQAVNASPVCFSSTSILTPGFCH